MVLYLTDPLLYCPVKRNPYRHCPVEEPLALRDTAHQRIPADSRALRRLPGLMDVGEETPRRPDWSPELAALMRPAMPALVASIIREVWRAVPVYARPGDGPYGRVTRHGVERAVTLFVDLVEDPLAPRDKLYETCRRLGAGEAHEGRTLDDLQAAYRVGTRVGWQWIMRLGRRHRLSSMVMARLAEMLFGYADELARMSIQGYREAQAEIGDAGQVLRRRLLRLIVEQRGAPDGVVAELAEAAGWPVPDEVVAVALEAALPANTLLGPETLADLDSPHPYLLMPASVDSQRLQRIAKESGARIALGPPTVPGGAADSLRWARTALRLAASGVLPDTAVTRCADHLITLWLLADEPLVDQVARQELAPLAGFSPKTQVRLGETLLSWLRNGGNAAKIAVELSVHPQTARYRVRQLKEAFGDRLHDPDARFAMETALRAKRFRAS